MHNLSKTLRIPGNVIDDNTYINRNSSNHDDNNNTY